MTMVGVSMLERISTRNVDLKPIVILDEPTSGLCKGQMASTVKYLQKMKEEGKTVIVITHDYEFIKECKGVVYEFLNTI